MDCQLSLAAGKAAARLMIRTTFRATLALLLVAVVLAMGCVPASQVKVVEVTTAPEVRVVEVTATPSSTPTSAPQPITVANGDGIGADVLEELPLALVGTLIDGTGAGPVPDAALVIRDGRIVAVGRRDEVAIPADARRIDLPQATILPGFINTHVHNAYVRHTLRTWAQAGVTTVRDVGAPVGGPHFF